jgi:hypothetical protein
MTARQGTKAALVSVIAFMALASGIDFYRLKTHRPARRAVMTSPPRLAVPSPQRAMASFSNASLTPSLVFQGQTYRLGSYNQRHNATWEFVTAGESVNDWTKLLTIVDRPDARTREELDLLAEGLLTAYKSHGAKVLATKTLQDGSGAPYNYLVVAFEETAKQRFELNFVKVSLGATNAVVAIHGARVSDPQDYRSKAKEFLNQNSGEIGAALATMTMPDVSKLPRRTF